jgi:tetratricopeptide (TPR) repeat protein
MGTLEAGIFDAVNDDKITLRSGKVIRADTAKNPICIVANYLFDTLYHDIFQVSEGILMEGLVSTGSTNTAEPDPLDPAIIQRLSNEYKYVPITEEYYLEEEGDEPHAARILKWYKDFYTEMREGASILIPIGALRALRRLTKFSNGRAIVISGDKGNNNPEQFVGLMDPHIAVHGSFSLMVNYHAIGMWFTSRGGFAMHNPQEDASLKVSCFVLHPEESGVMNEWTGKNVDELDNSRMKHFPHLCSAFHDAVNIFGPNDFFVMQKTLKEDMQNPPLRSIISLLKLSDWDADVFFKFRDNILNQVPNSGQKLKSDLCRGIPRLWQNYYELDVEKDIAFEIGRVYYGVKDYANALTYYKLSTTLVGEHHVTYHNQGLCYYSLGQLEQALELFKKAHSMNKDYEKARSWSERVQKEINEKQKALPEAQATAMPSYG